jgi:hypothetical protein
MADKGVVKRTEDPRVDEDGSGVVDDRPEFWETVQQETQARGNSNP